MTPAIVDPQGNPVDWRELVRCPQCDAHASERSIIASFGGHWRRICKCGFIYDAGQGVPPLED
ncbi:MAG TPA: hypothetical protein VMZ92_08650 [Planctomycetota bacterium]|nr:hypothetical protein [Planctomycetota bacterium]